MACYYPLSAFRSPSGDITFVDRGGDPLSLPCGRCIGCRLERSRQWATRIMFEAQLHDTSSFLTLTYSDQCLPDPPSLDHIAIQRFFKRVRASGVRARYYMCGEYGESTFRPHYHVCLFGHDFSSDRYLHEVTKNGHPIYRSPSLEKLWPYGFSSVCELNFETAAYVARYVLKKITGSAAEDHYRYTCPDTGEVSQLAPEYARMSLKPGIGQKWFDKYKNDVYHGHDYIVINGRKCKPPRYFDKLLRRVDPDRYDEVKMLREFDAYPLRSENMPDRLAVREQVKIAALNQLKPRSL